MASAWVATLNSPAGASEGDYESLDRVLLRKLHPTLQELCSQYFRLWFMNRGATLQL